LRLGRRSGDSGEHGLDLVGPGAVGPAHFEAADGLLDGGAAGAEVLDTPGGERDNGVAGILVLLQPEGLAVEGAVDVLQLEAQPGELGVVLAPALGDERASSSRRSRSRSGPNRRRPMNSISSSRISSSLIRWRFEISRAAGDAVRGIPVGISGRISQAIRQVTVQAPKTTLSVGKTLSLRGGDAWLEGLAPRTSRRTQAIVTAVRKDDTFVNLNRVEIRYRSNHPASSASAEAAGWRHSGREPQRSPCGSAAGGLERPSSPAEYEGQATFQAQAGSRWRGRASSW
jgi:hypothetical protein